MSNAVLLIFEKENGIYNCLLKDTHLLHQSFFYFVKTFCNWKIFP